jgi:hypothetical protein
MISHPRCLLSATALLGLAAWLAGAAVLAQESPNDRDKSDKGDKAERSIREQDIYIPYEKLRQVFEKHGRGVFLPYEKFQELWRAAQDHTRPAGEIKPPLGALITEINNAATVEKDVVRVKARVAIDVLAEGWNEVPLRLADAAITAATLADRPARIVGQQGQGYRLLIEKKGKQPETMELVLEYAKSITRSPGQNSVSFQTPQAPVSRWRVVIPQGGVKVNLYPLIAATELPAADKSADDAKKSDETVVLAFVGAAPTVRIDWTPKAEGATGLATIASVEAQQRVWIGEGVVRTRTTLHYAISRAELARLTIEVPADQKVVNVFDPNVRQWSVAASEADRRVQTIAVQLFEPAKTSQQLIVELEKFVADEARATVAVPMVKAVGVGRQQGVVVVQASGGLRVEPANTVGMMQIDAAELPPALRESDAAAIAYRYASVPYAMALGVEKVQPRITVDSLVHATLQPDRLTLNLIAVYTIQRAGVFRLELDVPAGFDVRSVRGTAAGNATPVQVDTHYLEGDKKTRLVVNLSRKAINRAGLAVELQRDLHLPELLAPPQRPAVLDVPIPRVAPRTADRATGRLVLRAPENLQVHPEKVAGLRAVSLSEAYAGAAPPRSSDASLQPVAAFAYSEDPAELTLSAQRRKPQVTARQLLVARVEEGVVKYEFSFDYDILYSGVKRLRIDVPKEVAAGLRVATPGFHEKAIDPQPADVAKDDVAWQITGDSELFGKVAIALNWEKPIEKLDVGKKVTLSVPRLKPREVQRAWGQIALVKSETIEVSESKDFKQLRRIDPQRDLAAPVPSAARAFEFHDDWTLSVEATRYEAQKIKWSSVDRALVRMVVTPADMISVQALYRVRSAQQRLTVKLPERAAFDSQPLWINGRPTPLESGGSGTYFVPLASATPDVPLAVELRYTLPGDGRRLLLPEFPDDTAVVKAYLAVYLPTTRTLLGTCGDWTEDWCWWPDGSLHWKPAPDVDPNYLPDWVREDAAMPGGARDDFQTDGQVYLFSTLRPAGGQAGAIEMTILDARLLDGLVFGVTALLGLLLLAARLPLRAAVLGLAVVGLVLAGAFLPTFSMQILNGVLAAAIFVVAALWFVAWVLRCRKRLMSRRVEPQPPAPQQQPETAAPTSPAAKVEEGGQNHA